MPLRDTRALRDWAISAAPGDGIWDLVHHWVMAAGSEPWKAPSVPDESRSDRPNYEARTAVIPNTTVVVEYIHVYNGQFADLLGIG